MATTAPPNAAALADGIGTVIESRRPGYSRIVIGKRTLAYVNPRRGAVQLDFRAKDVAAAPARLRRAAVVKKDRALVAVTQKNLATARALLERVAAQA